MKVSLASGNIGLEASSTNQTDKRALLVYAGTFKSMDGDVEITPAHIEVLIANHNAKLEKLGENVRMADYPPIQLDHSTSAKDTVGRLVGALELGTHEGLVALYGHVRILGQENWEKVADGRWTHLSIGADLETGELQELTITPFPAAKNACLLSQKGEVRMSKKLKFLMENDKISEDEAKEKLATMTDEEKKELSAKCSDDEDSDDAKLSADKDEDDKAKLAAEEKEKAELAAKKLAEDEEKEKEDKEKKTEAKAKMSAALKSFQDKAATMRLSMRTANLQSKFARLKASAKVTPAELKKMDFVKLAAANDETINAVLKTYEDREPVIHTGQFGSFKATNVSEIAKEVKFSNLENETRQNMALLRNKNGAKTKLAEFPITSDTNKVEEIAMPSDHTALWSEIAKAMQAGDEETAKGIFLKAVKMGSGDVNIDENNMATLMSSFTDLEENFSTVVRLATETSGIKL
jgi:hypothetical protein